MDSFFILTDNGTHLDREVYRRFGFDGTGITSMRAYGMRGRFCGSYEVSSMDFPDLTAIPNYGFYMCFYGSGPISRFTAPKAVSIGV